MEARARRCAAARGAARRSGPLTSLVRLCASPKSAAPRGPPCTGFSASPEFRKSRLFGTKIASESGEGHSRMRLASGIPRLAAALVFGEAPRLSIKWHELLADGATLERVTGKMGFNADARGCAAMARERSFPTGSARRPDPGDGSPRSAGQEFDHLW